MNYRHHFHAGNFADVMKHILLLQLLRAMQRKEKGFLYVDTHAGRGAYQLSLAARGDSLERKPEWPAGIGRVLEAPEAPPLVEEYLTQVRTLAQAAGRTPSEYYPGSPLLAAALCRPQDRLVLYEKLHEEAEQLRDHSSPFPRALVKELDGYTGLKASLPPPERRALVLIDPPYEEQTEFETLVEALAEALRRLPSATIAVWYPLTQRARIDTFFDQLGQLDLPPAWVAELWIAGEASALRMRGCGLLVLNPPWKLEASLAPLLPWLSRTLAQAPGAGSSLHWLVPEAL